MAVIGWMVGTHYLMLILGFLAGFFTMGLAVSSRERRASAARALTCRARQGNR